MSPQEYVHHKMAAPGSSFYYACLFLPAAQRAAITALYAFCRELGGVVDSVQDPSVAASKLAWWQSEVAQAFVGTPSHPVMQALLPLTTSYGIEASDLLRLVQGCQMDLQQTRYLDYPALERYCRLTGGATCEVAVKIYGQGQSQTQDYAQTLGVALQLTRIIRNVGMDARRGRVYIPVNELQQFDVKVQELVNHTYSPRFHALMQFQAERAHTLYEQALALLPASERRSHKPALMVASMYRTLLREMQSDGFQVLHQRVQLTPLRKFWLAWKVQALGRW